MHDARDVRTSIRRRRPGATVAVVGVMVAVALGASSAGTAIASTPVTRSVSASHAWLSWNGHPYRHRRTTPGPVCPPRAADPGGLVCDHLALSVNVAPSYWSSRTGGALITISWTKPTDNFDLYVYGPTGRLAAGCATTTGACQSTSAAGTTEQLFVPSASGAYDVRVSPVSVADEGYTGEAQLVVADAGGSPGRGGGTGPPPGDAYQPGVDTTSWYWYEQAGHVVSIPPKQVKVDLPNPEAVDTLPVGTLNGRADTESVMRIDLAARGVKTGSSVTSFVLKLAEDVPGGKNETDDETHRNLQQEFNVTDATGTPRTVQACPATMQWPATGGAKEWADRPAFDPTLCVKGTRDAAEPRAPYWTFDLSTIAQGWADDPSRNYGIVFVPVPSGTRPTDKSWQVNFRIPHPDDPRTANDEYAETRFKAPFDLQVSSDGGSNRAGGTGGASGGATPPPPAESSHSSGGTAGAAPTGDFSAPQAPATTESTTPTPARAGRSLSTFPKVAWWVWLLVAFGGTLLVGARAALFELTATAQPDGVVAAIRHRNAERGGVPAVRRGFRRSGEEPRGT